MRHRDHVDSLLLSIQMMQRFLLSISNIYIALLPANDTNVLVGVTVTIRS